MSKKKRKRERSGSSKDERKKKKRMKMKKLKKKRRRSPSTDSSSSSSSSSQVREKLKKKNKKKKTSKTVDKETASESVELVGPQVPADLPKVAEERPKMAPMTKEEWEKKQSVIRRVYDETTGRHRLIKGDGEVLEEIVSRDRHKEINRLATAGDGAYFQSKLPQPGR